jgi:diguanylate cyclase (GGDEF)-like protein
MRWIGSTRASVVALAVTAFAISMSVALCLVTYRLVGLSLTLGTPIGVMMLVLPILAPLIVAPMTCLPVIRTVRHNVVLLSEIEQTRAKLLEEIAVRRALQRELEAQVLSDPLTGLLNRRGFFQLVARCDRPVSQVVVLDVDGLKPMNDDWGHASGDLVLCAVADALREVFGPDAITGRLGGDEFAVVVDDRLPIGASGHDQEAVRDRVRAALADVTLEVPFGAPTGVSASIGSAPFALGGSIDAALALADRRMYAEKRRSGSGRAVVRG